MPAPPDPVDDTWREPLRLFHLTGHRPAQLDPGDPDAPLTPAAFADLARPENVWGPWPLVLPEGDEPILSFEAWLCRVCDSVAGNGTPLGFIPSHVTRLARAVDRELEGRAGPVLLSEALDPALDKFAAELDVSDAGRSELLEEIQVFRERADRSAAVLALAPLAVPLLYAHVAARDNARRRRAFGRTLRALETRLDSRLRLDADHAPEGSSATKLRGRLGAAGAGFVDSEKLSRVLPEHRGPTRLDSERRARMENALKALRRFLDDPGAETTPVIVHGPQVQPPERAAALRWIRDDHPLRAAGLLFDQAAARVRDLLRAVQTARLDLEDAFDAGVHGRLLAELDWRSFGAEELALIPPIAVLCEATWLEQEALTELADTLRSGRPLRILAEESPSAVDGEWRVPSPTNLAAIAVSHRETLVARTSLVVPDHLTATLSRLAESKRPALLLATAPKHRSLLPPALELQACLTGRIGPLFLHDPAAGDSWAERFGVEGNADVARPWPMLHAPCTDDEGSEQTLTEPFTAAHAAALFPACRPCFLTIPTAAWSERQLELADYLAADTERPRGAVPFVWVVDGEGVLARAVVNRAMTDACAAFGRAWRSIQELGGVENEHARRAADHARNAANERAAAEREELVAAHAVELADTRDRTAAEVIDRLVAGLMNLDPASAAALVEPAPQPSAPATPPAETRIETGTEAAPTVAELAEQEEGRPERDEPYIESMLCTSCNDCININRKLFVYNANKQAEIGDPAAGTFAELVKAAEKCPARCISPGKPRAGDPTVTDKLLARARAFR